MFKIELNRKVIEQLKAINDLMERSHILPTTEYFPFIICFEWVNHDGIAVDKAIQNKRIKLCEAYNLYLQDGEAGSFEQLKLCLNNLLNKLETYEV